MNSKLHSAALIFFAYLFLCPILSHAKTILEGHIESCSWERDGNPYIITDTLFVPEGQTLHVGPGVEVYTNPGFPIFIYGSLISEGNEELPILFSSFNKSDMWNGIIVRPGGHANLEYTIIEYGDTKRSIDHHGGGLKVKNGSLIMDHCTLRYNNAKMDGGGLYIWKSDFSITNCVFHNNTSKRLGSAIDFANYNTPTSKFEYNLIYDNHAEATAAVFIGDPYFTIDHTTFYNNTCGEEDGAGDIRVFHWVQANLTNCIFWRDEDLPGKTIDTRDGGEVLAFYCMSNDSTIMGENIIYGNPLFVDPVRKDFRLLPNSPGKDTGDPFYKKDEDGSTTDLGAFPTITNYLKTKE